MSSVLSLHCRKASDLVVGQASRGLTNIRQGAWPTMLHTHMLDQPDATHVMYGADVKTVTGVVTTADTMQQRIRQGPAQVQSVLINLQKRLDEQRLMSALKVSDHCTSPLPLEFPYDIHVHGGHQYD